jgi:hypothetical protein
METTQKYKELLITDIKEGFVPVQTNILIKTILFALLFYIISNTLVFNYLKIKLPRNIDINLIQTLIFALIYYLISINL